jgi:hypothetical protein
MKEVSKAKENSADFFPPAYKIGLPVSISQKGYPPNDGMVLTKLKSF